MFCVKTTVCGEDHDFIYSTVEECLRDDPLRLLFSEGHVEACVIVQDGRRVGAPAFMTWERFSETLLSNAKTILRHA